MLSDTSTWLPLDELAVGFDAYKPAPAPDLDGRAFDLGAHRAEFGGARVTWNGESADAEVFLVDEDLYYAQFQSAAREASSLVLDVRHGRALVITTRVNDSGTPRVTQAFEFTTVAGVPVTGSPIAPSTSLIGRRALWRYSAQHVYEHVYLTPHWYTWQCLSGPERGLADTDENSVLQIRPGIFVFAWREKVIPCAAVTIADHRDARNLRSHGALFGLDRGGDDTEHFTFGAHGHLLGITTHPDDLDPAHS
ncbi:MoaF C-terminal domain-containing protein [Lentzea sp. NPDC058450]|uniref:MoaF C-terminal domain-containing protein n=1 Tax=Lentzea sp. NPDC058450 TaxID=3346505 RepID=UPI00364D991F